MWLVFFCCSLLFVHCLYLKLCVNLCVCVFFSAVISLFLIANCKAERSICSLMIVEQKPCPQSDHFVAKQPIIRLGWWSWMPFIIFFFFYFRWLIVMWTIRVQLNHFSLFFIFCIQRVMTRSPTRVTFDQLL